MPFERASSSLPTVMSARIIAADSKYSSCSQCAGSAACVMAKSAVVLYTKAAPLPSATSVSMFGAPWIRPRKPLVKNR